MFDETWEYDGGNWSQVIPATTIPAARTGARLAFDAARGVVVMFGGGDAIGAFDEDDSSARRIDGPEVPP